MVQVKAELTATSSMLDIGPISFNLWLKVQFNQENRKINLSQPACINKVLNWLYLKKANAVATPMKKSAIF